MGERLHNQNTHVCTFSDCKAAFRKPWKLEAHLCKHTGLRPFSCENCDKSFCTHYQLTRHERKHSGEKPHKCPNDGCSETFVTSASMKNHMARVHLHQEKRYPCNHQGCEKDFKQKNQLKAHKCEHGDPFPFHCSFSGCVKDFPCQAQLKHHEKVHKGYPCDSEPCPFLANTWSEYQKHRKEHEVKLPCGQCEKLFNCTWFLHLHHLRVHSGEKRYFLCTREGCGKKFRRRLSLESHELGDHEGKKPFGCAYPGCGKTFAMKEILWRHGKVHDPAKKKKRGPKKDWPSQSAAAAEEEEQLTLKLQEATLEENKPSRQQH
ncbi:general transcription factor IIIA, b [Nothobranchius furzeri]|uniref:Transcription factor IIIA n=1 Tax=Nothobranchius furzeri TaxID=105023 RepID=A0A8C6Q201_NOTFU|nr:general transcription factor IIIA [Nothobranchius furzeri]